MQKILLAIIASAVVVAMLPAFGTPAALATPSSVTGNPGAPINVCGGPTGTTNPTPGLGGPQITTGAPGNGGLNAGGAHNPNSQASANYPTSTNGHPTGGAQYDASCHQQGSNPGHTP